MRLIIRLFLLTALFFSVAGQAGITVGGTRLVYNADENEASISVSNSKDSIPFLIQSWLELEEKSPVKVPFIVTPPLFRLDGGHENTLRVIYTGESSLPDDRESVFWLNVKSIPSMEKSQGNRLLISVKTRIKLFYRPTKLNTAQADEAWKKILFKRSGNQILVSNPTPYFISPYELKVDGQSVKNPPMVSPFGTETITASGHGVAWKAINDFGGVTDEVRQVVH